MKPVLFKKGDKVRIKHQPAFGCLEVVDPCSPTDMVRVFTNERVEFYVVLRMPKDHNGYYHQENVELCPPQQ